MKAIANETMVYTVIVNLLCCPPSGRKRIGHFWGSTFWSEKRGAAQRNLECRKRGPLSIIPPARAKPRERAVATPTRRKQGTCCRPPAAGRRPPRQDQEASAKEHRPKTPRPSPTATAPMAKAARQTETWVREKDLLWGSENGTDFGVTAYALSAFRGDLFAASSTRDHIFAPQGWTGVGHFGGP